MADPLVYWEIQAKNPKKLQDFYGQMFSWGMQPSSGSQAQVQTGSVDGMISQSSDPTSGCIIMYIQVQDVQATLNKATQLGARMIMAPNVNPDGTTACMIQDPEGNFLMLISG